MVDGDIAVQTHRVLRNLAAILEAAGSSLDRVVRTTVYLADMNDFAAMNEVYGTYFASPLRPAPRSRPPAPQGRARRDRRHRRDLTKHVLQRLARSTSTTPSTLRSDLITFCRCLTSLISTVMSIRPI